MKDFLEEVKKRILIHDGSKGYMLQRLGLKGEECGEFWNITNPDIVKEVYRQYREAGSDVLQTNTFPGNRAHLDKYSLGGRTYEINYQGARLAREVAGGDRFVSGSVGPTGILFEPSGPLDFDRAYEIFKEQVKALADGGADIINFETFTDIAELRAALLAAKENTRLPVICSMAFESGGRTLMGTDIFTAVAILKALGADMVGANCSLGAGHMTGIIKGMHEAGAGMLSVKPNAGLPEIVDGSVVYNETAESFSKIAPEFVKYGARLIGGCCGTTPEFVKALKTVIWGLGSVLSKPMGEKVIASNVRHILVRKLEQTDIARLDAYNDAAFLDALKKHDFSYIEDRALDISSEGYDAVYINIDAAAGGDSLLADVANTVQGYVKQPLILHACNATALEKALRIYKGIAGVVVGEKSGSLKDELIKSANKYGSEIVDLTLP